jgi:YVTN family beta-propeller protein
MPIRNFAFSLMAVAMAAIAQTRSVPDPGTVTTRQTITPAGVPTIFKGRVYGVTFGAKPSDLYVLNATDLYQLDWKANRVVAAHPLGGTPGLQSLRWDPVLSSALAGAVARTTGIQLTGFAGLERKIYASGLGKHLAGGLDIAAEPDARGRRVAVLPLTAADKLAVIDLNGKDEPRLGPTGIAPFGAAVARDGSIAYVSNWGGRLPKNGDLTAPTGYADDADRVVVDSRGVASTGTVSRIDLGTLAITHTIQVGLHPTAIVWDEPRSLVYVANSNSDSVSVIDSKKQTVVRTFGIQPFSEQARGIAPTALALSSDGRRLYAACGGINAVAVIETGSGKLEGLIPTGWYPNAIALSGDGTKIAVTSLLGAGSGWRDSPGKRFVHAYRGSVNVIEVPDEAQLAGYSRAVAENSHLQLAGTAAARSEGERASKPLPVPARSGDPSPIEHVVVIVKENRTYDQVFGDLPQGNGDPSLVMFGRDITPNQHRLAEEFVLLDNFYATGGNSADGHQWITQANETAYCLWPGYAGRSYPFDGTDPIAYSSGGFLWDYALAAKKTVRIFGEYVGRMRTNLDRKALLEQWRDGEEFTKKWNIDVPIARLESLTVRNYPSYTTSIPDVIRADIFLSELQKMEKGSGMPNLTFLSLPSNHTNGTSPNASTPQAMVADNDLALGKIVEALTHSRFWPKMAIFVLEDDAQNGVDHVDGHRTVALAISPYVRRKHIDSTFYSTQSMVKTVELILGLPTMSLFDLIAHDMRNSFREEPDVTPYSAVEPKQSLYDRNPPAQALRGAARAAAIASSRMRWEVPDAVPSDRLNRILWHQSRGWKTPYPGTRSAVFSPLSIDIDDEDRDER